MKLRKIWFTGFWNSFNKENNMFTQIIKQKFDIELTDNNPDFVICSPLGKPYDYMRFACPRIMFTGEFLSADFNAIDYFIGFDRIEFGDRNYRYPLFLYNEDNGVFKNSEPLSRKQAIEILTNKKYFCNYIFGHDTAIGKREEILYKLLEYKRVECAGKHKNNMPSNERLTIRTKHSFMKQCKFSISAESVCYPGFTSEKLGDAFVNRTIPIYYGDPTVGEVFNKNAFVNCHDYQNIQDAVNKVIEIDKSDEQYIEMLCQCKYNDPNYENKMYQGLKEYIWSILDQDKEVAYRRPRFYRAGWHETYLAEYNKYLTRLPHRILKKFGI